MSISEAHSAAARQNGAQSHGPVTDEGKARSARNAQKHGLFGAISIRTPAESEAFTSLLNGYLEEFQPATIFEHRCVREMVNAEWRLSNVRHMVAVLETQHLSHAPEGASSDEACAAAFQYMANNGHALSLALRYEKHFQRQFEKAHKALTEARRQRALDRETIARRTDQAMANMLKAMCDAPPPPFPDFVPPNKNVQNEPKPPAPNPQNSSINPTLNVKKAPNAATPNLYNS